MAATSQDSSISGQVKSIAAAAIQSINQLTSLIEKNPSTASGTSTTPVTSNAERLEFVRSTQRFITTTGPPEAPLAVLNQPAVLQDQQTNALTELRSRFPTVSSRGRGTSRDLISWRSKNANKSRGSSSSDPYSRNRNPRRAGRPSTNDLVAKDVVILDAGKDKIPTKPEKVELERNGRIVSGVDIDRRWDANILQQQLSTLLAGELEGMGFEIVKNCSGTLVKPNIRAGKEIDAKLLLKSIAPGGYVYIRLLEELLPMGLCDPFDEQYEIPFDSTMFSTETDANDDNLIATIDLTQPNLNPSSLSSSNAVRDVTDNNRGTSTVTSAENPLPEVKCPFDIKSVINGAKEQNLSNPVEVLRFIQQQVVSGRALDVASIEETLEGETNYITVDRDRIIESTFSELEYVDNFNITFKVDFMGEESVDLGGPRKEWIRLINHAIKLKYFDHGLRPLLSPDYYFVGVMIAVAMLQNGQLPVFLSEEILEKILSSRNSSDPCIYQIQRGLEMLGMLSALMQLPTLVYLLRPGAQQKVNVPKLLQLLKPKFSEEGSNALKQEKETYQMFVRYVREVAASRRVCGQVTLDLSHILQFTTGAAEEPALGFVLPPSLKFILPKEMAVSSPEDGQASVAASFLPFAHTCSNILELPSATSKYSLPSMEKLFELYDVAFCQSYFGKQ